MLKVDGETVQISMPPHLGSALSKRTGSAKRLRLLAAADHSPKTSAAAHPVYEFEAPADSAGQALE